MDSLGIGMTSERTRRRMVERLREQGIADPVVLEVMQAVPRHWFVDEALAHRVYDNNSLPIGFGQTLSNSYTVARMTSVLRQALLTPEQCAQLDPRVRLGKVLEIGTGSGYQTSVLAAVVSDLYTVERIPELQRLARQRCQQQRLRGIHFHVADGHWGLPRSAPYQGILCTAAPAEIPAALCDQLDPEGGALVLPVGAEQQQQLVCVTRVGEQFRERVIEPAHFVPLVPGKAAVGSSL